MRILLASIVVHALIALFGIQELVAQNIAPCSADATFSRLDFLIGSWTVKDESGATTFAETTFEKVVDGCAITEKWLDSSGFDGLSLFYFSTSDQGWKQVWVTQTPKAFGGVKEASMEQTVNGNVIRFLSSYRSSNGQNVMDRSTLTLQQDRTVLHEIEVSFDNGNTWTPSFKGVYHPSSLDPTNSR